MNNNNNDPTTLYDLYVEKFYNFKMKIRGHVIPLLEEGDKHDLDEALYELTPELFISLVMPILGEHKHKLRRVPLDLVWAVNLLKLYNKIQYIPLLTEAKNADTIELIQKYICFFIDVGTRLGFIM